MSKPKGTRPGGLPDPSIMQAAAGGKRPDAEAEEQLNFGGFGGPPVYANEQQQQPVQTEDEDELYDEEEDEEEWIEEDEEQDDEGNVGQYPTPVSLRQPGGALMMDEPLFEGGPLISEVNSWKKQFETEGHTVHLSPEVAGENFIWRSLARTEYREIMNLPNTDPLQREEIICEICILFPYNYDFATMASQKAGVPAVLAEHILHESGFQKPTPPVRL